eukprot:CAMPEP_0117056052 /NCGR_PEP_ID=MMETSP0472-20121206/38886_1 /TAXON_ID=693140 ORGANISM="Tiarina fusus, Strain LIS" /NCGR_SAMPLE_ID=MMETSP0472 /ASSEMBLY_ACC=CAM_ASM_000603 /LENGTH=326 /DNA_ID=CAMNT_0004772343 /DNA_START=103 /DNA_END=1083 /DNA_ORIENTATION=-
MCISNVGNRRPYSTTGAQRKVQDVSLLSRVAIKNEFSRVDQSFDLSAFEPKPLPQQVDESKANNAHIVVQHNYHDHANDSRADYQEEHPARGGVTTPFPLKLHEMLETVEADGFSHVVSWQPHGRCFVVHKPKEFVELLPTYFKLSKLASFQRQLNLYGFQRLTRGQDRGGYYHELFLRGKVFLAHSIQRIKVKGTGVRARSNPEQEPNFWVMPWVEDSSSQQQAPVVQSVALDKQIGQLPLQLNQPKSQQREDFLCAFGDKTFHYLDPFQPASAAAQTKWTVSGVDELLASEADSFFEDFDFPEEIGAEIEDDDVFGDMLEQMIA